MTRFEPNLRVPGPTGLPPSVREVGGRQMINHRGAEFAALLRRIETGMQPFFGTGATPIILSCAGTGGLEAAAVNVLSPGDRVLAATIGVFGDRFAKVAEVYGANVDRLGVEWGTAMDAGTLRAGLADFRTRHGADPKAVFLTHNETSTGVQNDIGTLAAVVRAEAPDTLICVDAISGLGAVPFAMDTWGCDVVITGSQKAWMAAPGLAMIAVSERGWAATEAATTPRFYLDLRRHRDSAVDGQTPWTPAVSVMYQVDEGLRLMHAEGLAGVFARHVACAAGTRAGLRAIGFELLADDAVASRTVTAAHVPADLDWKSYNGGLKARGLMLAGGQGKLTGKIFRVGHLGSVTTGEIIDAIAILEATAIEQGRAVAPGAAVAAAQRAILEAEGVAAPAGTRA